MATITTTTNGNAVIYPGNTLIDRSEVTGYLYVMVKASTADTYQLFRSTDNGASWSLYLSVVRTNLVEVGSLRVLRKPYDQLTWCYRTNESSQDRIYIRTIHDLGAASPAWNPEVLVSAVANGGTPGSVYSGMDMENVTVPGVLHWIVVAVGTEQGGKVGTTLFALSGGTLFSQSVNNNAIAGTRQWLTTGSGRSVPSLALEHNGDGKTVSTPHLWVGWGRTNTYCTKLGWTGSGWNGPSSFVQLSTAAVSAQDYIAARFDGSRFITVAPDPTATSTVVVWERNKANSITTTRNTPTHPQGVITSVGLSWNRVSGDLRVFATGTSNAVLYSVDFTRQSATWGAWSVVNATAVIGSPPNKWNVRRGSSGSANYDVVEEFFGSPNTVVNTIQGLNYAPDIPTWDVGAMGRNSGEAADVNATLTLDWTFSDANPSDTQSAYALSRQIGAGALAYLRSSDSTWQPTEQKNLTGSSAASFGSGWQPHTDAATTFRVKVWDAADTPSVDYSDGYVVVPSQKVNPTITAPTAAQVITTNQVTASWTVSEQTQFRITLATNPGGLVVYDSGWVVSPALTFTVPVILADLSGWTLSLQTRNNEGLPSNVVTVNFSVDMIEPAAPTLVATPVPASGIISVAITNAAPTGGQPALSTQELYRRVITSANVLTNPSFEVDLSGWTALSGSASRVNTQQHNGSWSALLTPDGVGVIPRLELNTAVDPLTAEGEAWTADGWIRPTTANKPVSVGLVFFTAGDVFISAVTFDVAAVAGAWLYLAVTATAPATTGKVGMRMGLTSTPAVGDTAHIDELRLRRANSDNGVRIAAGLGSGATYPDWGPISGVAYEYRALAYSTTGTSTYGPWTA